MPGESLLLETLPPLLQGKRVLFLSHARPDLDTLSSGMALSHLFSSLAHTTWGVSSPLDALHEKQLHFFSTLPSLISSLHDFDIVVCVDFRSPEQAGPLSASLKTFSGKVIIFDHHSPSPNAFSRDVVSFIHSDEVATAQMVAELALSLHHAWSPAIASALAAGIIADSARFMVANPRTFFVFDSLLRVSGKTYEELFSLAAPVPPVSNRVGIFHALKHATFVSIDDHLLGSMIHSHQSSWVASALIQMGCDIGLSISYSPERVYTSIRLSNTFHHDLDFDATRVFSRIASQHEGTTGGHPRAAQLNLPPYFSEQMILDSILQEWLRLAKKKNPHARIKVH